jgi:hypothetical protein
MRLAQGLLRQAEWLDRSRLTQINTRKGREIKPNA